MNIKPNPEVYRLAAEIIQRGEMTYTCFAIGCACNRLRLGNSSRDLHEAQYRAMFGPNHRPVIHKYESPMGPRFDVLGKWDHRRNRHVFWNSGQPMKEERMNALLFMAAIVEG